MGVRSPCDAGNAASVWVVRPQLPSLLCSHLQVPFLLFLNLLCHSLPPHGPTTMLLCSTWSNSSICWHQQFHTLLQLALLLSPTGCLAAGIPGIVPLPAPVPGSLSPRARAPLASLCQGPYSPGSMGHQSGSSMSLYTPRISFLFCSCF